MTHKPNRVHKATGWIAVYVEESKNFNYYNVFKKIGDRLFWNFPPEIVEGEGWEEEKSELYNLMFEIEKHFTYHEISNCLEVRDLILEFAKNYKEQKS